MDPNYNPFGSQTPVTQPASTKSFSSEQPPIVTREVVDLCALGIEPSNVVYKNCTMQSSRWITVIENQTNTKTVCMVDLSKQDPFTAVQRKPISADAAIMNPFNNRLALRAGNAAQVFDMVMKTKVDGIQTQNITFWTWLNESVIGFIDGGQVFHWTVGESRVEKMFDLDPSFRDMQVLRYRVEKKYGFVCAIGVDQGKIRGKVFLFCVSSGKSTTIFGPTSAAFCPGPDDTQMFVFADESKFTSVVLNEELFKPQTWTASFAFGDDKDFPSGIEVSPKWNVAYVVTKYGLLHVCTITNSKLLCTTRIQETPFVTTVHEQSNGILAIFKNGKVLSLSIDKDLVTGYVKDVLLDSELAAKMEEVKNQIELQTAYTIPQSSSTEEVPLHTSQQLNTPPQQSPLQSPRPQERASVSSPNVERDTEKETTFRKLLEQQRYPEAMNFAKNCYPQWVPNVRSFPDSPVIPHQVALALARANLCAATDLADYYFGLSQVQPATAFLLDYLQPNRQEDAALQTKLLEMNFASGHMQVALAILSTGVVSHYDRQKVAVLAERAGAYHAAVEHYTDFEDIKRILSKHYRMVPTDWLLTYVSKLTPDQAILLIDNMLQDQPKNNAIAVAIVNQYVDHLFPEVLTVFTKHKAESSLGHIIEAKIEQVSGEFIMNYINSLVSSVLEDRASYDQLLRLKNMIADPKQLLALMKAAWKYEDIETLERILTTNSIFDREEARTFLLEQLSDSTKLPSVTRLVKVLYERFNMLEEYLEFLLLTKQTTELNKYVAQRDPYTLKLTLSVAVKTQQDEGIVKTFLDKAKIVPAFADVVTNATTYLETLELFTHAPSDANFIDVAIRNKLLFKLIRFLNQKQDQELWTSAFNQANKDELIEAIAASELQTEPQEFSECVKSVMAMGDTELLVKLLESVLFSRAGKYRGNRSLQNLLLLSSVKLGNQDRSLELFKKLDNYDCNDLATIVKGSGMIECALEAYKKGKLHIQVIQLYEEMDDLPSAFKYADAVDLPEVWKAVGKAQINQHAKPKDQPKKLDELGTQ